MAFTRSKYTRDPRSAMLHRITLVESENGAGLCTRPGVVHIGGNSGYQAINLAYHLGAREIVLTGFDMRHIGGRAHWHRDHAKMNAPALHLRVWIRQFEALARDLERAGVRVINATPGSALPWFPFGPLPTS